MNAKFPLSGTRRAATPVNRRTPLRAGTIASRLAHAHLIRLAAISLTAALLVPAGAAHAQGKTPAPGQYAAFAKGRVDVDGGMVRVAAAREGIIASVHAEDGAEVKRGALLAQLDDRQARLLLEAARNEANEIDARMKPVQVKLTAAERELARIEPLVASLAVSRAERDEKRDQVALIKAEQDALRAQATAAQTRIKLAALEVELRAVRAPADGRVIKRFARAGDAAAASNAAPLFLFAPKGARVVRADLEERFVATVAAGMPAEVVLEADETRVLKGRIARIGQAFGARAPSDDPAERADVRAVEMIVTLDAPAGAAAGTASGKAASEPLIGQRVLVRIAKGATSVTGAKPESK